MNPTFYKKITKEKVSAHSFIHFKELKANHEKGRMNSNSDHKSPQDYLTTNKLTNKQMSLLFNLRCNSVSGIRANFPKQYFGDLQCRLCRKEQDSQIHLLQCSELKTHIGGNNEVEYTHIYGTINQQTSITLLISSLLEERERLLESEPAYRGTLVPDQ